MFAIFKRRLLKNWLMILGWGIGLGVLCYYLFEIYNTFFQRDVDLMQLFNAFPEDLMAFFGGDVDLFTPSGFLQLEFFSYMPIVLGIMVISAAANLISKDEEEGSLSIGCAAFDMVSFAWGKAGRGSEKGAGAAQTKEAAI
jgi:hypothetical protein